MLSVLLLKDFSFIECKSSIERTSHVRERTSQQTVLNIEKKFNLKDI